MTAALLRAPSLVADAHAIGSFLAEEVGGSAIHLVAIPPDGGPTEGRWFGEDAAAAARWAADRNGAGRNVYWTVNRVRPGVNRKPSKADIVAARFAHLDIDPPKDGGAFDKASVLAALEQAQVAPTFVVDSGGGVQAFWALGEAATIGEVEALNRGLLSRFGGDGACFNADRLMRVPGTVNWPNAKKRAAGRAPALAELAVPDLAGATTRAADLRSAYPAAANDSASAAAVDFADADAWDRQGVAELGLSLADPLVDLLTDPPGNDRSGDTYAAACELVRRGCGEAQVLGVLLNPDLAISAHCLDQADPVRAARRAIAKARSELAEELSGFPALGSAGGLGATGSISATPYDWKAPHTIPQRQWLYGRQLLRGAVSVIVAPGGTGKTAYTIGMALALTTGRALLGKEVHGGAQTVWLWNLEDSRDELDRAIAAAAIAHGIKSSDAADRLFVDSGLDGAGLCTAVQTRHGVVVLKPVYAALSAEIQARGIDCLIVDPFVSSQRVPENDNGAIDEVAKAWARVAADTGCAIVLVHHTSKLGGAEVTAERARGASALVNAARSVTALNRMTPDEARAWGIAPGEGRRYFRAYDDKNNRAPAAEASDWFRLESVDLPNGADGDITGDSVGVVMPWEAPTAESRTPIKAEETTAIVEAVAKGEYLESDRSPRWVGRPIARILGLDPDDKADRAQVRARVRELLRDGTLATEERRDGHREMKTWVVLGRLAQPPSGPLRGSCRSAATPVTADHGTSRQGASSGAVPESHPFRGDYGGGRSGGDDRGTATQQIDVAAAPAAPPGRVEAVA